MRTWTLRFVATVRQYKTENLQFIFLDETYINQYHNANYSWFKKGECVRGGPVNPKGHCWIILHAGAKTGWISNALQMWVPDNSNTEDYHGNVDTKINIKWF